MNVSFGRDKGSTPSIPSDDAQPLQSPIKRTWAATRSANNSSKTLNEGSQLNRNGIDSQGLEARLVDMLRNPEWEEAMELNPARGQLLSQIRTQLQGLSYLNDLENEVNELRTGQSTQFEGSPHSSHHRHGSFPSNRAEDYVASSHRDGHGETGWKLEVKRWKRVNGRNGTTDLYDESEKIEDIRKREREIRSGGYVLNVYDEYDPDGNISQVLLEISSAPLLELLRHVITFYPGPEFDLLQGRDSIDDTVVLPEPFMILFAHQYRLQARLAEDVPEDPIAKQHLKVLLDFLRTEHPIWTAKKVEIEEGRATKISFDTLWLLYQPNTEVYACKGADDRQVVVYSRDVQFRRLSSGSTRLLTRSLVIQCWDVTYDRGVFKRNFQQYTMEPYSGEKNITNLPLVPARFMSNEMELRERLIARGQRYYDLKQAAVLQDYFGDQFPRVYKDEPVRVVVDEDTYWRKNVPRADQIENPLQDYGLPREEESLVNYDQYPYDTTLLRCFPEVGVFSLRDRQWALVKVDDLRPVNFREKAFKRLVINKEYKSILKALVCAYMQERAGFSDIVSGKGRGLAILLHGPPGTGKTLTAECVAEREKRPLYTISCGDLGTEPEQLEVRLKEVFEYAVSWKAILLLDEADIFLQERNMSDLTRNALVTIFLRELEYFDGIIFLTTNRPGDIDEAFVSRIHVTLGLNQPDPEERRRIWALFIRDLDIPDDEKHGLLKHATEQFDRDKLNGRQIRNTIRVALALAQLAGEPIKPKHLDDVVKIGREYARYNKDLNKGDPEDTAVLLGRRAPPP